jgi:hypothetical protein
MSRARGSLWAVVLTVFLLALPAAAQAQATWHLLPDPAPGTVTDFQQELASSLAVLNNRPYLAVNERGVLTVHTLSADRTHWRQIGGALNTRTVVGEPVVATSSKTVWVAWREETASGLLRVHAARLRSGRFKQVNGGLGRTTSSDLFRAFDMVVFGGRPYISYRTADGRLRVVRLDGTDRQFRSLNAGLPSGESVAAKFAVVDGRLLLAYSRGENAETTQVSRLNARRTAWQTVASQPAGPNFAIVTDAASDGQSLYIANGRIVQRLVNGQLVQVDGVPVGGARTIGFDGNGDLHAFGVADPAPGVTVPHMSVLRNGTWQEEAGPPYQGDAPPPSFQGDVSNPQFVTSGGSLWFLWNYAAGLESFPRSNHVARFGA